MNTNIPNQDGGSEPEGSMRTLPQADDVVELAGSIAQRMIEGVDGAVDTELKQALRTDVAKTVSLVDMTPEQLAEWLGGDNLHNGSHFMSPADNERYQELCSTDLREAIKFLRDKWGEYVDRDFIQSFALVHWVSNSEDGVTKLDELLGRGQHEVEISTQAYSDDTSLKDNPRWLKAKFGVLINGQVNLASNADIQTNQWHGLREDDTVKRRKYTEWANRLMTNEANCVSPYEFVVGDWKAAGIVVDPDAPNAEQVRMLASQHGLPVIDTHQNDLFVKQATERSAANM